MEKAPVATAQSTSNLLQSLRNESPLLSGGDGFANLLSATTATTRPTKTSDRQDRDSRDDRNDDFAVAGKRMVDHQDTQATKTAREVAADKIDRTVKPAPVNHGQERRAEAHARNDARKTEHTEAKAEKSATAKKTDCCDQTESDPVDTEVTGADATVVSEAAVDIVPTDIIAADSTADQSMSDENLEQPITDTTAQQVSDQALELVMAMLVVLRAVADNLKDAQADKAQNAEVAAAGQSDEKKSVQPLLPQLTSQQVKETLQQNQDKLKEAAGALWPQLQEKLTALENNPALLQQVTDKLNLRREERGNRDLLDLGKFDSAGKALEALVNNNKNVLTAPQSPALVQAALRSGQQELLLKGREQKFEQAAGKIDGVNHLHADHANRAHSYEQTGQLSALRASRGGAAGLPAAVEQVALALHRNVRNGNDQMTIQLKPVELGRVDIKLDFADGRVTGVVLVENQTSMDLLQKDVRSLERALQEAGLRADSGCLDFQLRGEQQNQDSNTKNKRADDSELVGDDLLWSETDSTDSELYYVTPGRVNLRV
jgi:flagellar hook-length control protein FliK